MCRGHRGSHAPDRVRAVGLLPSPVMSSPIAESIIALEALDRLSRRLREDIIRGEARAEDLVGTRLLLERAQTHLLEDIENDVFPDPVDVSIA